MSGRLKCSLASLELASGNIASIAMTTGLTWAQYRARMSL